VRAVDLDVEPGQIHAVVGLNGLASPPSCDCCRACFVATPVRCGSTVPSGAPADVHLQLEK